MFEIVGIGRENFFNSKSLWLLAMAIDLTGEVYDFLICDIFIFFTLTFRQLIWVFQPRSYKNELYIK